MRIFNEYEENKNQFKFVPNFYSKSLVFDLEENLVENPLENSIDNMITIKTNKPVQNQNNYFYWEIDVIKEINFHIGFGERSINPKQIIGQVSAKTNFSIFVDFENHRIDFYTDKIKDQVNKPFKDLQTVGMGFFSLTGKVFATINGEFFHEINTLKFREQFIELFPHITLNGGTKIRVKFSDFKFNVETYVKESYKEIEEKALNQPIKKNNIDQLVKSYLNQNGFNKTLKLMDSNFRKSYKKNLKNKSQSCYQNFSMEEQANLTLDEVDAIRMNVIQNKDWDYLRNQNQLKNFLSKQMNGNVIFLQFLEQYFNFCNNEKEMLFQFKVFESLFQDNKDEIIYGVDKTLEECITDILLKQNLEQYERLISIEYKNDFLGRIFQTSKNNSMSYLIAHLSLLFNLQNKAFGMGQGYDFGNLLEQINFLNLINEQIF